MTDEPRPNGTTHVPNEVYAALIGSGLTPREKDCAHAICRLTFGWHKEHDAISYQQIADLTGIDRRHVRRTLADLVAKKVVCKTGGGSGAGRGHAATWGINPNVSAWQMGAKTAPISETAEKGATAAPILQEKGAKTAPRKGGQNSPPPKKGKKEKIETTSPFSAGAEKATAASTPNLQQAMFGALCTTVGWDYRTLPEREKKRVAQTVGILIKAGYGVPHLERFQVWWRGDWRYRKDGSFPTPEQVRTEIGKLPAAATTTTDAPLPFVYGDLK